MVKCAENFQDYEKHKDFLICIDSDGCVFDVMGIKWKGCFIPNMIRCFELQPIAKYVREEAEKINLYSKTRGINRFAGIPILFERLEKNPEVKRYGVKLPDLTALKKWISTSEKLSIANLEKEFEKTGDIVIERTIMWSKETNKSIKETVYGIPPIPYANESLAKISEKADIVVISSANMQAIKKEWGDNNLLQYVSLLGTQELATKMECISRLKTYGYENNKVLMIGDSPGDLTSAKSNDVLFYPIVPEAETQSWKVFYDEISDKFFEGTYEGTEEDRRIAKFGETLKF